MEKIAQETPSRRWYPEENRRPWVADPEATYFWPRVDMEEHVLVEPKEPWDHTTLRQENHKFTAIKVAPSEWADPVRNWDHGEPLYFVVTYADQEDTFCTVQNTCEVHSIHGSRSHADRAAEEMNDERAFYVITSKEVVEVTTIIEE